MPPAAERSDEFAPLKANAHLSTPCEEALSRQNSTAHACGLDEYERKQTLVDAYGSLWTQDVYVMDAGADRSFGSWSRPFSGVA